MLYDNGNGCKIDDRNVDNNDIDGMRMNEYVIGVKKKKKTTTTRRRGKRPNVGYVPTQRMFDATTTMRV